MVRIPSPPFPQPGGASSQAYRDAENGLRDFLSAWTAVLDPGVTVSLLASYGRLEELTHYAGRG